MGKTLAMHEDLSSDPRTGMADTWNPNAEEGYSEWADPWSLLSAGLANTEFWIQ